MNVKRVMDALHAALSEACRHDLFAEPSEQEKDVWMKQQLKYLDDLLREYAEPGYTIEPDRETGEVDVWFKPKVKAR